MPIIDQGPTGEMYQVDGCGAQALPVEHPFQRSPVSSLIAGMEMWGRELFRNGEVESWRLRVGMLEGELAGLGLGRVAVMVMMIPLES